MFFYFILKFIVNSVYVGRFLGFFVYVLNLINKEEGFLCYYDINYIVIDIFLELIVFCDVQGCYVIYYNLCKLGLLLKFGYFGKVFINFCEVEVYGKIFDIFYFLYLKIFVKNWNF